MSPRLSLRKPRSSDSKRLHEIWERNYSKEFPLPDLSHSVIDAVVVDENDKVLGFGIVKLFAEAVMTLDKSQPTRVKIETLRLLFQEAIRGVVGADLHHIHAFVQDPEFSRLMKKHFGFETAKGEAIVTEV